MPRDDIPVVTPLRDEIPSTDIRSLISDEVEQALLGALFRNNSAYHPVIDVENLRSIDFASAAHRQIFDAIANQIERGHTADVPTVANLMAKEGSLAEIGGAAYLVKLADPPFTHTAAALGYARQVKQFSQLRTLVAVSDGIRIAALRGIDPERPPESIVEDFDRALLEFDEGGTDAPKSNAATIGAAIAAAEKVYQGRVTGIPTGLTDLDKKLGGGLRPGNLIFVAGRPSMGKTGLAVGIAMQAAVAGKRVFFPSLEMTYEEIGQRELAAQTGISLPDQQRGIFEQLDKMNELIAAGDELERLPLAIDDNPSQTVAHIRRRALRQKRQAGLDLLIVDHLHLIGSENARTEKNRVQELSAITKELKRLAKELDVPVLAMAQLNRQVENRADKRPQLADLRDSGSIEEDGDVVVLLYREEYYLERDQPTRRADENESKFNDRFANWTAQLERARGIAELNIAKQRNGETGQVKVRFDAVRTRFENLAWGES